MTNLLLRGVSKSYAAVQVINGIDLEIEAGEFVVFVGPSGCGKSTLLRMIAGLEPITSGELSLGGTRVNETPASKRGVAMVFQSYALYPHMNVYKNMSFGLETAKMPKAEIDTRVHKAADILQISHLLSRRPKQLSGGQRQRVAIGRAIVRDPDIFLFDEPLSNLDAELRVQTRVEIAKLHAELRATMIYVTHDQVEAMTLADRIVVLRNGLIEQHGTPLEIYNKPVNRFVAGFIGSPKMNFLNATIATVEQGGLALDLADIRIKLPRPDGLSDAGPIVIGLRPEHITAGAPGDLSLGFITTTHVERLGGQTIAYGQFDDGQLLTLVLDGQRHIEIGDRLPVSVSVGKYHLFREDGRRIDA